MRKNKIDCDRKRINFPSRRQIIQKIDNQMSRRSELQNHHSVLASLDTCIAFQILFTLIRSVDFALSNGGEKNRWSLTD